jgi:hypothetical protein
MTMTPAEQRAIINKESAWVDDSFGQLDLTAFPALNELPPEQSRDDSRFAREYGDTALSRSASALRQFVADPDAEALERVGAETNNEGFRDEVRQRKGESIASAFKRACPDYIPTQHNYQIISQTLAFNTLSAAQQEGTVDEQVSDMVDAGHWTVTNLISCFNALTREGLLDVPLGSVRNLSTAERLRVTRLAQSGRVDEAIGEHLRCALDGEEPGMEILNDPNYRDACDDAVWAVFADITYDYVPTAEREAYIQRHCAGRPVTLALLQSAWSACQASEQRYQRGELLNSYQRPEDSTPPSERGLNAMSDSEVDRLFHASLKEYANSFRRGPGVLA